MNVEKLMLELERRHPGECEYLQAVRELGLPELVIGAVSSDHEVIRRMGAEAARKIAGMSEMPDAIQTSDYLACGLLTVCFVLLTVCFRLLLASTLLSVFCFAPACIQGRSYQFKCNRNRIGKIIHVWFYSV